MQRSNRESHGNLPALRRGNGWEPFSNVLPDSVGVPRIGDLFESYFAPTFLGSNIGRSAPALDLSEAGDRYEVVVDLPGYAIDQVDVKLENNVLTISSVRPEIVADGDNVRNGKRECHIMERSRGDFSRSIRFPTAVDSAGVKAEMRNGVLTITLPKAAESRVQKIRITGG